MIAVTGVAALSAYPDEVHSRMLARDDPMYVDILPSCFARSHLLCTDAVDQ